VLLPSQVHFPSLTVRETLQFALDNSNADISLLTQPASSESSSLASAQADKVGLVLELLGLQECADTIVGNALVRGISGGQKKRSGKEKQFGQISMKDSFKRRSFTLISCSALILSVVVCLPPE